MQRRFVKQWLQWSAMIVASLCTTTSLYAAPTEYAANTAYAAPTEVLMPQSFSICTDTNFQFPFSFMKNQKPVGLHIDIIDAALHSLGIEPHYEPTIWSGCLDRAKAGSVDAVATAAYMDERARYMYYPSDALDNDQSQWRITQVQYKVITSLLDNQGNVNHDSFDGTIKQVPQPVRVPTGYFIVHDLQKAKLKIKEGATSLDNFQSLLKDKTGSVVDLAEVAEQLGKQSPFANQFYIHPQALVVKSYYLAFSKSGHLNLAQAQRVWDAIAKVREDKDLMASFLKKY